MIGRPQVVYIDFTMLVTFQNLNRTVENIITWFNGGAAIVRSHAVEKSVVPDTRSGFESEYDYRS